MYVLNLHYSGDVSPSHHFLLCESPTSFATSISFLRVDFICGWYGLGRTSPIFKEGILVRIKYSRTAGFVCMFDATVCDFV